MSDLAAIRALVAEVLARDMWTLEQRHELRRRRLRALLGHTLERSPYYREALGRDAVDADLTELPMLSKPELMEQFDCIVTDPRLHRDGVEAFVAEAVPGAAYLGDYRVFATSGTTGVPGVFVFTHDEFAQWIALCLAEMARLGVTAESRLVAIGAPGAVHVTRQLFGGFQAGREGAPLLNVTTPLHETVAALNAYRPEAIVTYPTVAAELADEQLLGRLDIAPRMVAVGSEVLTDESAQRIEQAWGIRPVNVYASTEAPFMAVSSPADPRLRMTEGVILEVVDERGRPAQAGEPGSKVLLTNLVNHAQPLIRYELSDSVVPAEDGQFPSLARVDGRSDDILTFAARAGGEIRVHPYRLRAPFTTLLDVRQYQIVQVDDTLLVRVVPSSTAPADLLERVRSALAGQLVEAAAVPPEIRVEPVAEIERDPGHAAKRKLVARR